MGLCEMSMNLKTRGWHRTDKRYKHFLLTFCSEGRISPKLDVNLERRQNVLVIMLVHNDYESAF